MRTWILAWFFVAVVSTLMILTCLLGLARHILLVGRTARQARDEIQPIAEDLSREAQRASDRASSLKPPGRARRS
jgi:hypothetical protein